MYHITRARRNYNGYLMCIKNQIVFGKASSLRKGLAIAKQVSMYVQCSKDLKSVGLLDVRQRPQISEKPTPDHDVKDK